MIHPTYYVRHPDGSYTEADPQPVQPEPVAWDVEESVLAIHRILKSAASFSTREDALRSELKSVFQAGRAQPSVPQGWKLLKDSTIDERSWPEDFKHENGNYQNLCCMCGRVFNGYKRRVTCKVCHETPAAPVQAQERKPPYKCEDCGSIGDEKKPCWCNMANGIKDQP